jgi:hypothetical protein
MPPENSERAGRGGVIAPVEHRFTADRQPSPEAKSKGRQEQIGRDNLLNHALAKLILQKVKIKIDGKKKKMMAGDAMFARFLEYVLTDGSKMTLGKAHLILDVLRILAPAENKINFTGNVNAGIKTGSLLEVEGSTVEDALRKIVEDAITNGGDNK